LVAGVYLFYQHQIDIQTVLWLWLGGNIAALSFSVALSLSKRQKIDKKHFKLDKKWIIKGISVSLPFIFGSLAYKTIEFSDRYLIDYFLGKQAVGVYSFFANMANVLNIVLFTLVVSVLYPSLVESIMQKNHELFEKVYKQFKKETFLYALLVGLFLSVLLPVVLLYIHKPQYLNQMTVFALLLLGNIVLNWSFLYHFIIYAHQKDWKIFKATAWAALINIVLNIILIPYWQITGAAVATLISFIILIALKYKEAQNLLRFMKNTED
jgi:O-antigen/teichoic acid export membrane protein